jgi:hypothetical protein
MKNKSKIPQLSKDIKDFLSREEGNMVKKDIVKLGMGLLVFGIGLRSSMKADEAEAAICTKCGPPTPCHPY